MIYAPMFQKDCWVRPPHGGPEMLAGSKLDRFSAIGYYTSLTCKF
jgi:hypothetical protein